MTVVFGDSFYYLALLNPRDSAHSAATQFSSTFRGTLVTTWGVLIETGDAMSRASNRNRFLDLYDLLQEDPSTEIVPIDEQLFDRALDLFRARPDKDWSLTDCFSFVVMTEFGLTEALTGDHHFEQAGFQILLKPGEP